MKKSQMTIVMSKNITEEESQVLQEMLDAPALLKLLKTGVKDMFEGLIDDGSTIDSVEIEIVEESKPCKN